MLHLFHFLWLAVFISSSVPTDQMVKNVHWAKQGLLYIEHFLGNDKTKKHCFQVFIQDLSQVRKKVVVSIDFWVSHHAAVDSILRETTQTLDRSV